jgi:predicted Zn-dependent protease
MIEFERLANRIFNIAGKLPLRISIRSKKGILARFSNNGVHQNGFQDLFFYTLSSLTKNGPIFFESNDGSDFGIRSAINNLKALAPNPPPLKPTRKIKFHKVHEYFPIDLAKMPDLAAYAIEDGLKAIRKAQASANGYFSAYKRFFYFADSNGLRLFHPATAVRYGITITKGEGKGYFAFYHPDSRKLNVDSIVKEALHLAQAASQNQVSLKPGIYECVFSPRAFLELIEPLRRHFDLNLYQSGKSVFSHLLGKRVFSESFTLHDDVTHPKQFGVPFDGEGKPKRKIALIERGVLKNLLSEGNNTQGIREHPFDPENLVAASGSLTLKEIFSKTKKGIFINKIRYHALVHEHNLEVTGLTTAGSVYIENGSIQGQLSHARYHDSIISLLRGIKGASKERILIKDGERGAALLPYFWIRKIHIV